MGQSKPTFFKVLSQADFASHLRLPPLFIYKFGKLLPESPTLRVGCGGSEGEWRVKVDEVAAEGRCFTDGWPEFVTDLGLGRHDFLVFWLESQSKFLVEVYNEDGTAKILDHLPTLGKVSQKKKDACEFDMVPSSSSAVIQRKTLSFSVKIKHANNHKVHIPANFMRWTRIESKCGVVKDTAGREWPMMIRGETSNWFGTGWGAFKTQNNLHLGDTCTFTYNFNENELNSSHGWVLGFAVKKQRH
ncbi:unnamed protein product [Cuscuta campestris]|uniref:TF-B3 domain-containing protein n=1 Tax=Cuscuta campestris TaxID=132261 RepID=A0A484MU49_9ASTE|nr:unnamed protein product [Cuscuta campestris]